MSLGEIGREATSKFSAVSDGVVACLDRPTPKSSISLSGSTLDKYQTFSVRGGGANSSILKTFGAVVDAGR